MSKEFDLSSYGTARSIADEIYGHAKKIHDVFENVDELASKLHGSHWNSSGSDTVSTKYLNTVKSQFEPFYLDVCGMKKHVYDATDEYEKADQEASEIIDN